MWVIALRVCQYVCEERIVSCVESAKVNEQQSVSVSRYATTTTAKVG